MEGCRSILASSSDERTLMKLPIALPLGRNQLKELYNFSERMAGIKPEPHVLQVDGNPKFSPLKDGTPLNDLKPFEVGTLRQMNFYSPDEGILHDAITETIQETSTARTPIDSDKSGAVTHGNNYDEHRVKWSKHQALSAAKSKPLSDGIDIHDDVDADDHDDCGVVGVKLETDYYYCTDESSVPDEQFVKSEIVDIKMVNVENIQNESASSSENEYSTYCHDNDATGHTLAIKTCVDYDNKSTCAQEQKIDPGHHKHISTTCVQNITDDNSENTQRDSDNVSFTTDGDYIKSAEIHHLCSKRVQNSDKTDIDEEFPHRRSKRLKTTDKCGNIPHKCARPGKTTEKSGEFPRGRSKRVKTTDISGEFPRRYSKHVKTTEKPGEFRHRRSKNVKTTEESVEFPLVHSKRVKTPDRSEEFPHGHSKHLTTTEKTSTHNAPKPHICSQCGKMFAKSKGLRSHMISHSNVKPHICDECGKGFTAACRLRRHMTCHTGEKPHHCSLCKGSFTSKAGLQDHMLTHTGEKPHCCSFCGKLFAWSNSLRKHILTHTGVKSHSCPACSKSFAQSCQLKSHMLTHTGEKSHKCTICDKGYGLASGLRWHMKSHANERPYQCSVCNKCFLRANHLHNHMLIHRGIKSFTCTTCNASFTQRTGLVQHQFKHTGDKPHECTICDYRCAQPAQLKKHMLKHNTLK